MNLNHLLLTSFVLAVAATLEWKNLKKTSPGNRWFFVIGLLISGLLWNYVLGIMHVPRPIHWLKALLEPFVPIP